MKNMFVNFYIMIRYKMYKKEYNQSFLISDECGERKLIDLIVYQLIYITFQKPHFGIFWIGLKSQTQVFIGYNLLICDKNIHFVLKIKITKYTNV